MLNHGILRAPLKAPLFPHEGANFAFQVSSQDAKNPEFVFVILKK
jgi:hypothetical protein